MFRSSKGFTSPFSVTKMTRLNVIVWRPTCVGWPFGRLTCVFVS